MLAKTFFALSALLFAQTAFFATGAASTGVTRHAKSPTVLINAADVSALRDRTGDFTAIIHKCAAQLNYTPSPVRVFAPDPHYTSTGINVSSNNGKQLAADADVAYGAGLCYLLTGNKQFAANAQRILDSWAGTLKEIPTLQGKDGVNFDLPYMIVAASWVRGAGGWNDATFSRFLKQTVLPV